MPGNPDSGAGAAAGNFRAFASDSSRSDGAEGNRQGQGNRTFVCGRTITADLAHLDAFRSACVYGAGGDRRFFYMEEMRHKEQEEMHLMILNTKQRLIRDILLFRGTFNHSPASPREIFIEALRYHAASIVLVHNHPSGDPTPSAEDRRTTVRIQEAGAMLGIRLLDHVIIGEQAYFSFKERGILSL